MLPVTPAGAAAPELVYVKGGDLWRAAADGRGARLAPTPTLIEWHPRWVPGRDVVVFSGEPTPATYPATTWQLWMKDVATSTPALKLTNLHGTSAGAPGVRYPTVSADGSRVVFDFRPYASGSGWWLSPQLYQLTLGSSTAPARFYPTAGRGPVRSPPSGRAATASPWSSAIRCTAPRPTSGWSPRAARSSRARLSRSATGRAGSTGLRTSGEWMAATRWGESVGGQSRMSLFIMRFDGSSRRRLTSPRAGENDLEPVFSDDGRKVYFTRSTM